MKLKLPSLNFFKNRFVRVLLIVLSVGGVCVALISFQSIQGDGREISTAAYAVPEMNDSPGVAPTPSYEKALKKSSTERINDAKEEGESALPTPVIRKYDVETPEIPVRTEEVVPEGVRVYGSPSPDVIHRKEDVDALSQLMQAKIQEHFEAWTPVTAKVVSVPEKEPQTARQKDQKTGLQEPAQRDPSLAINPLLKEIRPGKVLYAHLETEANSDIPSPVIAKVLSGPFKGATVFGEFKPAREHLILAFKSLSHGGEIYEIEAVGVDPDKSSFGMATDVDHHYFAKIIWPMAAAFVSGYGEISRIQSTRSRTNGLTEVVESKPFSLNDKLASAAGKGAETLGRLLEEKGKDLPNTITVAPGTPVGILILKMPSPEKTR